MARKGVNLEMVKRNNRASILNCVNQHGPISRKDISEKLGLTPAAVTLICNEFMDEGALIEIGVLEEKNRVGRRKVLVDLNKDYKKVIGINVEPEKTICAITNLKGEKIAFCTVETSKQNPQSFLEKLAQVCLDLMKEQGLSSEDFLAAGVSITGLVDRKKGISTHAYGIWEEEVAIKSILGQLLMMPIVVENNVTAFAWAELLYGLGREDDHLLFVKWGPGVGCAIVADKKVYEGRAQKAAELGHFIVEKNGKQCSCGRCGCLETKISVSALMEQLEFGEELSSEKFINLLEKEDTYVEKFVLGRLDIFAQAVVNSMTILAPNRVVLCGELFQIEKLRTQLIEACQEYEPSYNSRRIVYTELSEAEDYIGSVALATGSYLFGVMEQNL